MTREERSEFLEKEGQLLYGKIIDMVRVSPLTDRQFDQIAKSIKQYTRESMEGISVVLSENTSK